MQIEQIKRHNSQLNAEAAKDIVSKSCRAAAIASQRPGSRPGPGREACDQIVALGDEADELA